MAASPATQKLAVLGFGTVGKGLCEILLKKGAHLKNIGLSLPVVAVCDKMQGSVYNPNGLDVAKLLKWNAEGKSFNDFDGGAGTKHGLSALETCGSETNADTICEATWTDLETAEPATSHCTTALSAGKNVVTTNKGPALLRYDDVMAARKGNAQMMIEGSVMAGTPVFSLLEGPLSGNSIESVEGVLNGTCNFMLARMEAGCSYDAALKEAQALGYAEANPTFDVEGLDAQAKVCILGKRVFGTTLKQSDVPVTGITKITPEMIKDAQSQNKRYKLIAKLDNTGSQVTGSVTPVALDLEHPLAGVSGAANALNFKTDLCDDVTIIGPGAGKIVTGFALYSDIIRIHRNW